MRTFNTFTFTYWDKLRNDLQEYKQVTVPAHLGDL